MCVLDKTLLSMHLRNRNFNLWASQYTSYLLIFSPLRNFMNAELYEKYLCNQSSHYGNKKCSIVKACPSFIYLKVCVPFDHGALLRIILLLAFWATFHEKNNVRNAPASSALTLVLHRSHNTRTANRHLYVKGERNGAQRRTKINFGRTMMQALEPLQLAKTHILG